MWGPFTLFKAVQIQDPHLYLIEILNNSIVLSSYFQSFYTYLICFTFPLITFFLPHFLNFRNCARREREWVCVYVICFWSWKVLSVTCMTFLPNRCFLLPGFHGWHLLSLRQMKGTGFCIKLMLEINKKCQLFKTGGWQDGVTIQYVFPPSPHSFFLCLDHKANILDKSL